MKVPKIIILFVFLSVIFSISISFAATIDQSSNYTFVPQILSDEIVHDPMAFSYENDLSVRRDASLLFNLFDSSLGTLNSVDIDWVLSGAEVSVGARSTSDDSAAFGHIEGSVELGMELVLGTVSEMRSTAIAPHVDYETIGPPAGSTGTHIEEFTMPTASGTLSFVAPDDILQFIGPGTFAIDSSLIFDLSYFAMVLYGSHDTFISADPASPTVAFDVFFDYTEPATPPPAVPEPATILLLGSGLVGFAGLRSKKFKN